MGVECEMDYTGTRREGRETEAGFYQEVGEWLIAKVHPVVCDGHGGYREPSRPDVVKNWRLGGYRLASRLLPMRRKRFPEELRAFIDGMKQRMQEYEQENVGLIADQFDVEACERSEARAQKFLRLATHPGTPVDEARSAALGLAKMIAGSELVLLSWGRASHFAQRYHQMSEIFDKVRAANPFDFFFGPHDRHH